MNIKRAVMVTLVSTLSVAIVLFGLVIGTNIFRTEDPIASTVVKAPEKLATPVAGQSSGEEATQMPKIETPIESSSCGVKNGSCTAEQIAIHNTQSDCWVIYRGSYFDVTSYIKEHSGGKAVFNDTTCGKDIQAYLEGNASSAGRRNEHGSSTYSDLERLKIGPVID